MKLSKRILATILTFVLAFSLLGGIGGALAAAPTLSSSTKTLDSLTTFDLNTLLAAGETATWSVTTSDYATYVEFDATTGMVKAKKNTSSPIQFIAANTVANGDGTYDTAPLALSVNIPVSLAFDATPVTKVKGSTLDMKEQLTTAAPDKTHLTWSVVSGPGTIDNAGVLTVTGAGDIRVKVVSTIDPNYPPREKTITGVVPKLALTATASTITTIPGTSTVTATLTGNGSDVVKDGTVINWTSSDTSVATVSPSASTLAGNTASTTVTAVKNGSTTIKAVSAADNTVVAEIKIGVGTATHLDLTGPNLDKNNRYGTYTVRLLDAAGNVVTTNNTSKVHWDWSSSYLSMANDKLNDNRSKMHNGEAHIKMYARANTSGTRLYVWLDDNTGGKIYHTIQITGLSTLPQSGQDFTLAYVFGGLSVALLIAAGVWYGIRKKNRASA